MDSFENEDGKNKNDMDENNDENTEISVETNNILKMATIIKNTNNSCTLQANTNILNLWEREIISHFELLIIYDVTTKNVPKGRQISIKQKRLVRNRDYVITLYTSGTIVVQTKLNLELMGHLSKIDLEIATKRDISNTEQPNKNYVCNCYDEGTQKIFNKNVEDQILKLLSRIEDTENDMEKMRQEIIHLSTTNVCLEEELKKQHTYNIDNWEWVECRYEMLRKIPYLTEENKTLKIKNNKHNEDINIINIHLNEVDKKIGALLKKDTEEYNSLNFALNNQIESLTSKTIILNNDIKTQQDKINELENFCEWLDSSSTGLTSDTAAKNKTSQKENIQVKIDESYKSEAPRKKENAHVKIDDETDKSEAPRNLLLIGDSMIKYIDVDRIMVNGSNNEKICIPGATIERILFEIKNGKFNNETTDVLIHVGSNNIQNTETNAWDIPDKLAHLLSETRKRFPMSNVYFSSIIPKYEQSYVPITDKINNTISLWCESNDVYFINSRPLFVYKNTIRFERLSKRDGLHLNKAGVISLAKHLKYFINTTDQHSISPPPYSPPR